MLLQHTRDPGLGRSSGFVYGIPSFLGSGCQQMQELLITPSAATTMDGQDDLHKYAVHVQHMSKGMKIKKKQTKKQG